MKIDEIAGNMERDDLAMPFEIVDLADHKAFGQHRALTERLAPFDQRYTSQ